MLRWIIFCLALTVTFCLGKARYVASAVAAAVALAATPAGTAAASQRFALCNDGNFHDRDDICALPMELALLSAAGQAGSVVHVEYSNHFWESDSAQAAAMQQSATVNTANTWGGFNTSVFFDAHSGNNVNLAAVNHLTNAINQSSASSPLTIMAGGPMQTIGMALAASRASARPYVTIISHSTWNDVHSGNFGPSEGLTGTTYNWSQLGTMGANLIHIKDQNATINGTYAEYSWLNGSGNARLQWLWDRGQAAGKSNFDCSDAGMTYYALTGDVNASPAKVRTLLTAPAPTPTPASVRINCGGPAYTDTAGQTWPQDSFFSGGTARKYSSSQFVSGTADATLYQSERFAQTLAYTIPVANGSYVVTLYFAEMYHNAPGQRVFSVTLEGQPVIKDLDIWATVGKFAALQRTFGVTVNDGALEIVGTASVDNAQLAAIQVKPATVNQAPTVYAGPDQAITLPNAATLTGSAVDDGLPNPPGTLTYTWSKASGPGTVNFANPHAASTTASFSAAGSYTLQLLASDGALSGSDTVAITASTFSSAAQYIYAAQDDGTIRVYNINNAHALVKTLTFFAGQCDARGIAAATPTHRIYTMFNSGGQGHVACIDLLTDQVLWDHVIHPAVDRGDVTPDGKTLYVPSYEGLSNSPYEFVVDAISGNVISTIAMPIKTHDTICSLDGTKVFMENKSTDARIRTISTANNQIIAITNKFSGIVQPFAVNRKNTFVIADVIGVYGFQYADLTTGQILGTAVFKGTAWNDPGVTHPHGIGMTPNETEAWVCDRGTGNHFVHVFNITSLPPVQKRLVTISNDNPHWLTFTIDGRYCYVAGDKGKNQATDVVDTATYRRIGSLGPSEDLLEVDFNNGQVTATGSQFGLGRVQ